MPLFFFNYRYLLYIRVSHAPDDGHIYFKAACRAEMKKTVTYPIDVALTKHGFVHQSHCECAAGMGPYGHCKHICAVLCAILDFNKDQEVIRETSCTDQLQTFKRPRKMHTGSPVKAPNLRLGGRHTNDSLLFDPRPQKYHNLPGYKNNVRNLLINEIFSPKVSLMQTFAPANLRAVDLDHDYLAVSGSTQFLRDKGLLEMTSDVAANIELNTRMQSLSPLWRKERQFRITASNFGTICKATEKRDMRKLAHALLHPKDLDNIPAIRYGREKEAVAVTAMERDYGVKVNPVGLCVNPQWPFLGASPDGVIGDDCLLEVKCPYAARAREITPVSVPYMKQVNGQLHLDDSHSYYYQVQGQLMITGRPQCIFAVYTEVDMVAIVIPADIPLHRTMQEKLGIFYEEVFKPALLEDFVYKRSSKLFH